MMPCYFIGTLSQTLTLRAAFTSSTYLLSQIPGLGRSSDDDLLNLPDPLFKGAIRACGLSIAAVPSLLANSGPASDDALLFYWDSVPNYLNSPIPLFKGAIRACGLSIAAGLPCSPAPSRHLMMPCYFIGTLSQTISTPPTPFSRGHIRPSCAPELGAIASLFFGRHLMMPWFPK